MTKLQRSCEEMNQLQDCGQRQIMYHTVRANCGKNTCAYANWHNKLKLYLAALNSVMVSVVLVILALDSCGLMLISSVESRTSMKSEAYLLWEQFLWAFKKDPTWGVWCKISEKRYIKAVQNVQIVHNNPENGCRIGV